MDALSTPSISSFDDRPRSAEQTRHAFTASPSWIRGSQQSFTVRHARVTNRHLRRALPPLGGKDGVLQDEHVHLVALMKGEQRKTESGVHPFLSIGRVAYHNRYARHLSPPPSRPAFLI
jgi:hypothetical protein